VRGLVLLLIVVVAGAALLLAWPRLEGEAPRLEAPGQVVIGSGESAVEVAWHDEGSGLAEIEAFLEMDTGARPLLTRTLLEERLPGSVLAGPPIPTESRSASLELDAEALELPDGEATLVLRARDWSWRGWLSGNARELRVPVIVDTEPPSVTVESGLTYVRRGGSAAVVYRSSGAERDGVRVDDAFFPGSDLGGGRRVAIFAIPVEAESDPRVRVVAIDRANNEASARFASRVQERRFPQLSIRLSEGFLEGVVNDLADDHDMLEPTPVATFQRVNEELRRRSEKRIAAAVRPPSKKRFRGAFEQMYNSRVTSQFAELRDYEMGGRTVSTARHYGFDLASTAGAPITASNDGVVIFAEPNGIYGRLVLIDHGLGITTLYAHLSRVDVEVGDEVLKGQEIGRSGATGLAGGDHLHFAVLVGATYVDPVEWWDPKWVREHIEVRLAPGGAPAGP